MLEDFKRRWQIKTGRYETPFDTDVPFWMISLVFHLALILVLTRVFLPGVTQRALGSLSVSAPEEESITLDELEDFEIFESDSEEIAEESDDLLEAASAVPTLELVTDETTSIETPELDTPDTFGSDFAASFDSNAPALETVTARNNAGSALKSTGGAIDRIAEMIRDRMTEGDLMVVWIFDQSASLTAQRAQISKQFDRVYQQLRRFQDADEADEKSSREKPPLLTDIYQFGKSISPLLKKPSYDLDELKKAVANVVRDDSGQENVMQAVMTVVNKYRPRGRISARKADRNMMVIVVSDEAGDDLQYTDNAVRMCVEAGVSISTIGVPAPFGRQETEVKWVDPDPEYDQEPQIAIVDQGAETPRPERLRLEFLEDGDDFERIDSGFGPYDLTRLCFESGGLYFAVHPNRTGKRRVRWGDVANYASTLTYFFDPEIMRRYQPAYVSLQTYNANVSRAQKDAAFVGPELDRLMQTLKIGEADRENEQDPRWQAGFDLALGRAISARLRASTYNEMLALIKTSLKFDPPKNADTPQNNTWILRPSDRVETGSRDEQLAKKARLLLNRVVTDHPGTPWALLAQHELKTPIGWEWHQRYTVPRDQREGMGNGNNNDEDVPQENQDPKKTRPVPRL